ncbi:MAG: hypothetical protein HC888_11365 [Candidatus Competibacteraceae bacterium]|nr:hypothetical protein [Candidatus Competibacteraceae bacterium]
MFQIYMDSLRKFSEDYYGSASRYTFRNPEVEEKITEFREDFYGVSGNRRTFVDALVSRDLGIEVAPKGALPGDLVQFWRNSGSGHAVVFLGWVSDDDGKPITILYWSVQSQTGISRNSESIGMSRHEVDPDGIYVVRAFAPLIK